MATRGLCPGASSDPFDEIKAFAQPGVLQPECASSIGSRMRPPGSIPEAAFLQQSGQIKRKRDVTTVQSASREINIAAALGQLYLRPLGQR
jgi:hypothetical protein